MMRQEGWARPLVVLFACFLMMPLVASAAAIGICGIGPPDSGALNFNGDLKGNTCDFGDKTFGIFASTSGVPNGVNVTLTQVANNYIVTFTGPLLPNSFTLSYDVVVNDPALRIIKASADVTAPGGTPGATAKLTETLVPITGTVGSPNPLIVTRAAPHAEVATSLSAVQVTDVYVKGATEFSNTFTQSHEPATMALIGLGLVGMAGLTRRRMRKT